MWSANLQVHHENRTIGLGAHVYLRREQEDPLPIPPGQEPPPPVKEPPDKPVVGPDGPVDEPGPAEPTRL